MSIEIVFGESRDRPAAAALAAALDSHVSNGTVYLGYPVLATADERVEVDALLVSPDHGLVAMLLADETPTSDADWDNTIREQDRLYAVLESHLGRYEALREGRKLAFAASTATIFPTSPPDRPERLDAGTSDGGFYGDLSEVTDWIVKLPGLSPRVEESLQAALQRVTTIKPAKRRASVERPESRGGKLKIIEKGIANLDQWQKRAAIESPEGPQRIRGLAGSGKTVVLALKAAYWHTQHPEWNIALTFHSRALYQQISDLVTRFTFEHSNDRPDPERLRIVHSWGSRNRHGVYSMIAEALGETPRDWAYARGKYGMDEAFRGVCRELLDIAESREIDPIFDAVLIDEAQDLPPEFFRLVYKLTASPKRIAWGYDELQKLSEAAMPTTDELFGTTPSGQSLVSLDTASGSPRRDITLPICYRNTPWALATAHALGIGVYRTTGLLQHPDEPTVWKDIGYEVAHGTLEHGAEVTLERGKKSYPAYFDELLKPDDAVLLKTFTARQAQDEWVATQIAQNLSEDELEHDDILIVLPDSYRAKSRAPHLISALARHDIPAHLVGVNSSVDEVFQPGSVAIAHIYRAKGNEAPVVYAIDAQHAAQGFNAVTRRNALFTAITRSRAWVRIAGWGPEMEAIETEFRLIVESDFKLNFKIPTVNELATIRHIHRDRPAEHEQSIERATQGLSAFLEAFERGEIDILDLPSELRTRLTQVREVQPNNDDQSTEG